MRVSKEGGWYIYIYLYIYCILYKHIYTYIVQEEDTCMSAKEEDIIYL